MTKTVVLTGASDGIGAEAARTLVARGHRVILVGRSSSRTSALASELSAPFHVADFADLSQVHRLAEELRATCDKIDVLANNAGAIMGNREMTVDLHEKTFQVNHLAPFLLTQLLLDVLVRSRARVIQTSSEAARMFGNLDIDDLHNVEQYSPNKAYGDSKLANILFTAELHRRFHAEGISAMAFHPGRVATNFASDTTSAFRFVYRTPLRRLILVPTHRGGEQLAWAIEGEPGVAWQSGRYHEGRVPASKLHPKSYDEDLAARLWTASLDMLGLSGNTSALRTHAVAG